MKKTLTSFFLVLVVFHLSSQIEVTHTPIIPYFLEQVVADATIVSNVQVNSVDFDMINLQAGTFSDASSSMGLGTGIILGTGNVEMAMQPNLSGASSLPGSQDGYSDPDLQSLSQFSVNDQIVLEFDFIALGDTLYMEYVFASEEYPEYACSVFNDVIGVFLDGPNPNGGDYVSENIALVPDPDAYGMTDDPVAINSINNGGGFSGTQTCDDFAADWMDYMVYYVSNNDTLYEYDGRTVVLNLLAPVTPGQLYHMKIGTGDGSDTAFDSAFLIGANSFKTAYSSVVGIEELDVKAFEIYPNPADDYISILPMETLTDLTVAISDMKGRTIYESPLDQKRSIDLNGLDAGIYIIQIYSEGLPVHRERLSVE